MDSVIKWQCLQQYLQMEIAGQGKHGSTKSLYLTEHKNILLFTATETTCYLIHFSSVNSD